MHMTTNRSTKRQVKISIVSDIHLGTYGSKAKELLYYLNSIDPDILILNGDIIDVWQFSKHYFPNSHLAVIQKLLTMVSEGKRIYYITGNHDEVLRKFKGFKMGNFEIVNKLILELDGKRNWIFHGDVFDITMKHSKWIAKLGGKGYDLLIILNTFINWIGERFGRGKISLSKKIKNSVKGVVKHVTNFEETAAEIAIDQEYETVICGHIHQPQIREISLEKGTVTYLNSGDWVENLTALEYNDKKWSLYYFKDDHSIREIKQDESTKNALSYSALLQEMLSELQINTVN